MVGCVSPDTRSQNKLKNPYKKLLMRKKRAAKRNNCFLYPFIYHLDYTFFDGAIVYFSKLCSYCKTIEYIHVDIEILNINTDKTQHPDTFNFTILGTK